MTWQEKIRDFILTKTESFTARQVATDTRADYKTVKKSLREFVITGKVHIIDIGRYQANIYIVSNEQTLKMARKKPAGKSNMQLIKDFIATTTKPFSNLDVIKATDVCYGTVKKYLRDLIERGSISWHCTLPDNSNLFVNNNIKLQDESISKIDESATRIVKNFLDTATRPFTKAIIIDETGLGKVSVNRCLKSLLAEDTIRQIGLENNQKVYAISKLNAKQRHYTIEYIKEAYARQQKKRTIGKK